MSKEKKNLANCKPSEFMAQCGKVAKSVEKWLDATDIINIRKNAPKLNPIPEDATAEETQEIVAENKKLLAETSKQNLDKMMNAIFVEHPQETLELLALLCFVEPKDVDNYPISFYLSNLTELLNDEDVISFFTSLVRWGQMNS